MRKIRYKATKVKEVNAEQVLAKHSGGRVVVGIDVAKEDLFAAVMDESGATLGLVKWKQPNENRMFVELLRQLSEQVRVEGVLEPTGTYGDALRGQLSSAGLPVFRVQPKRTHDAAELYDGVPSMHDAKAATLLCRLHLSGVSTPWPLDSEEQRKAKAILAELMVFRKQYENNRNRLNALLSRHFPELTEWLLLRSVTLLELLIRYGGPAAVAENESGARELMRQVGGPLLREDKIEAILEGARRSIGVGQLAEECELVKTVALETRRNQKEVRLRERAIRKFSKHHASTQNMSRMVGRVTAAVLLAVGGDPKEYSSAKAYRKAFGLNLKERSSGTKQGQLHLTKRGSGLARAYLYMSALRYLYRDPVVRSWYAKKVARQGGQAKTKAVTAVMRKLVMAVYHVAQGQAFDARKLFDTRQLELHANAL